MTVPAVEAQGQFSAPPSAAQRPANDQRHIRGLRLLAIAASFFTLGNALWAAWDQGITYDEFFHLEWPRRLLHERIDERESAFRFDSKTPALLPAVIAVDALQARGIESEQVTRFASRLTSTSYLVLSLALVAWLARAIHPSATWPALLIVALDPNMAANGSIATSDVAYVLAVLVSAWAMVRANRSWASSFTIGATLGLAFAVKFTAVLLVPVALWRVARAGGPRALGAVLRIVAMTIAGAFTASALYLFVGIGVRLGSLTFRTPIFQTLALALPGLPIPFPRSILTGIDVSMDHNAHTAWSCYMFGETHPGGVWYYFLAHWLIKTPIALLVCVALGLWRMRAAWREPSLRILVALFTIHLAYFSLFFSTQLGLRYALLCIPLAAVVAGCGLASLSPSHARWLMLAAILAITERLPYWGDPIAFTNLAVWPKSRAYWYTADSNLDYGQNRERVARYVKESGLSAITDQTTVTPGLYVINANNLTTFGNFRANRWLIDHNVPALNFGFTDFGFSITGERFEDYMNDSRMTPSLPSFDDVCSGNLPHYAPGSKVPFRQTDHPNDARLWVICARTRKGVDLGFRVQEGRAYFGRVLSEGTCSTEFLQAGQATWMRVPAGGTAQLCLREIPFKRTFLPYVIDGHLTVRGQGADVEFRQVPVDRLSTPFGQDAVPVRAR